MSDTKVEPEASPESAARRRDVAAFESDDPRALYMNTGLFEQLQRVAQMMSRANLVPEHLRGEGKLSDCFLVVSQAFRWGMDPFAVAQCTYVTKGKLGYEGKLVAAVVNTSGRLTAPLSYTYSGAGKDRTVVVAGRFRGESAERTVSGTVGGWATSNEQWTKAADQMLAYRGAREWARRHMPEAVLGVQADDEIEAIDVTPSVASTTSAPRSATVEDLKAAVAAEPEPVPAPEPDGKCQHPGIAKLVLAGKLKTDEPPPPCGTCGATPSEGELKAMLSKGGKP